MKPYFWLLFAIPFLLTCKKDKEEDNYFILSGQVLDATTGQPMPGLKLHVFETAWVGGWFGYFEVHWLGEFFTDTQGQYSYEFSKGSLNGVSGVYLGCSNLPENYQEYVIQVAQNGVKLGDKNFALDLNEIEPQLIDYGEIESRAYYTFKVFPKAYYQFQIPPLTSELKKDTLVLIVSTGFLYYKAYPLGEASWVALLEQVSALKAADRAKGSFELRRDTLIKSGTFDVCCPPYDTTIIFLDL